MLDVAYLLIFLLAMGLALVFVPVVRVVGARLGIVDRPEANKTHFGYIVRCGGVGIVLAFCGTLLAGLALMHFPQPRTLLPVSIADHIPNIPSVFTRLATVMGGALMLAVVGLIDDKVGLRPSIKLLFQVGAGVLLVLGGITVNLFLPGWMPQAVATVVWVVLITNAFNLLDNMNGLTAGVSLVCALCFYLVSRAGEEYFMMAMFAALAGSVAGYLPYNFPSARVYMGDGGALFIGYLFAALSIMVTYYDAGVPSQLPVITPLIVLGVPLFDTLSVMWIRWRAGKPLMQGDQNHFSHRLVALGFSRVKAVLFIWAVTLTMGLSAVNLRWLSTTGAVITLVQVVLFFLLIFTLEAQGKKQSGG